MLVELLKNASRQWPGTIAVEDPVRALTYRRLARLAAVMRGVVGRETDCERVGIMLPATTAFPAALFGVLWARRVAVPLNFLLNADELCRVVKDAEIDVLFTIRHFGDLAAKLPARAVFLEDLPLKREMLFATFRSFPAAPTVEPADTAVILYTSGTTAEPKGAELTYRNLHSNSVDAIASLEIRRPQTMLNVLPPFHVFGLTAGVFVPAVLGATVVAIPRFSPTVFAKTVAEKRVTVLLAIPSMYAAVLKTKSATRDQFRSVKIAISGGEPLPDSVRAGFLERFGVTLAEGYGLTETSPVVAACSPKAYREKSVGQPIRNVEVRLVGDDGRDVINGVDGEILIRGPGVMKGYFRKPEDTRRVIDRDGWFRTGDIGRRDGDGFLYITGRAKEMLIIGGENVFPREIEAVLENHPAVLQAAVLGVEDETRGEAAVAFVIPHSGADVTEADLRSFARKSLAGYKVPKQVVIREDLPKGPTGKILKRRLRDLL
jgi:long-chain acyl-CoA synthetase